MKQIRMIFALSSEHLVKTHETTISECRDMKTTKEPVYPLTFFTSVLWISVDDEWCMTDRERPK